MPVDASASLAPAPALSTYELADGRPRQSEFVRDLCVAQPVVGRTHDCVDSPLACDAKVRVGIAEFPAQIRHRRALFLRGGVGAVTLPATGPACTVRATAKKWGGTADTARPRRHRDCIPRRASSVSVDPEGVPLVQNREEPLVAKVVMLQAVEGESLTVEQLEHEAVEELFEVASRHYALLKAARSPWARWARAVADTAEDGLERDGDWR